VVEHPRERYRGVFGRGDLLELSEGGGEVRGELTPCRCHFHYDFSFGWDGDVTSDMDEGFACLDDLEGLLRTHFGTKMRVI
jgi:hypothetical protein